MVLAHGLSISTQDCSTFPSLDKILSRYTFKYPLSYHGSIRVLLASDHNTQNEVVFKIRLATDIPTSLVNSDEELHTEGEIISGLMAQNGSEHHILSFLEDIKLPELFCEIMIFPFIKTISFMYLLPREKLSCIIQLFEVSKQVISRK